MALFAAYGFFLVWQSSHELSQDRETTAALMEGLRNAEAGTGGAPLLGIVSAPALGLIWRGSHRADHRAKPLLAEDRAAPTATSAAWPTDRKSVV